jgi:hypothetical protein
MIVAALTICYEPVKRLAHQQRIKTARLPAQRLEVIRSNDINDPVDPVPIDRVRARSIRARRVFTKGDDRVLTLPRRFLPALFAPGWTSGAGKSTFANRSAFYDVVEAASPSTVSICSCAGDLQQYCDRLARPVLFGTIIFRSDASVRQRGSGTGSQDMA